MGHLTVITTPALVPGYRLAGTTTRGAGSAAEAEELLLRLLGEDGEEGGVVAVHEPYLESIDQALGERLREARTLVVGLPSGEADEAPEERRTRLLRALRRAVGYEITFAGEEDGR